MSMYDQLTWMPIPLATGDEMASVDGTRMCRVTGIRVVVSLDDGTEVTRPLDERGGGWFADPQSTILSLPGR